MGLLLTSKIITMKNNKFYNTYLLLSLLLFTIMFLTGVTDEQRKWVDNECFLLLLLLSTINMLGSVVLYAYHLRTQQK